MRSFSFFAILAAAALSFAAPVVETSVAASSSVEVATRTVPDVLDKCIEQVTVALSPLTFITKDNCTVASITPVVRRVTGILEMTLEECHSITVGITPAVDGVLGGALAAVFTFRGQVLSLVQISQTLSLLIHVICVALASVIKVVGDDQAIISLLSGILVALANLLQLILGLVGGILGLLIPSIVDIKAALQVLGVVKIFGSVGISLL